MLGEMKFLCTVHVDTKYEGKIIYIVFWYFERRKCPIVLLCMFMQFKFIKNYEFNVNSLKNCYKFFKWNEIISTGHLLKIFICGRKKTFKNESCVSLKVYACNPLKREKKNHIKTLVYFLLIKKCLSVILYKLYWQKKKKYKVILDR